MTETRRFIATQEAQPPFFAGIDLGGTNIKVGVVDDLGRPLSWLSIPTEVETGPEDAARRMGEAVHRAVREGGPGTQRDRSRRARLARRNGYSARNAHHRHQSHRLGQFPHPRSGEPSLRPAGHLRERRQRRRLWRILGRLGPRFPEHGPADPGHGHRLRHHHRRLGGSRRPQPRRRGRARHHRPERRRPDVRLRMARPSGSLRQRHGRHQTHARSPRRRPRKFAFEAAGRRGRVDAQAGRRGGRAGRRAVAGDHCRDCPILGHRHGQRDARGRSGRGAVGRGDDASAATNASWAADSWRRSEKWCGGSPVLFPPKKP